MTHSGEADVLVIGAGIVGSACARACALAGLRTLIVERDVAHGGATAAAMGHVVLMHDSPAQWALTRYGQELWRAVGLPEEAEYREPGTLWLAADGEEMDEVERKHNFLLENDTPGEILTASALREAEPHLRAGLAGALLVPRDAVLKPPVAAAAFLAEAEAQGARRIYGDVTHAAHGEVSLADGRGFRAPVIVLATGAALELLPRPDSGLDLVRKRKGHLLLTEPCPSPCLVRHQLVELGYLKSAQAGTGDSVACNIQPRSGGQLLVGSSRQFDDEDPAVRPEMLARMLARAVEYLPALAALPTLRAWTGFRAATPDKLPLIGPALSISGDETLHLATGHEGLGITTSLATAELLVDGLLGRPSAIARAPYLPARIVTGFQALAPQGPTLFQKK